MHHFKDAHDFHILDWKGHSISIPLPIILWTKNGLVTFMSSEFQHDDSGTVIVEKNGQKFVKVHEEIYYADEAPHVAHEMTPEEGVHHEPEKPLDFSITKLVFSMFLSVISLILIFGFSARAYSKNGVPKGIAKFTEPLVVFIRDEVAIPNIVGISIELFKDTSLVMIIGLFDLLSMVHLTANDSNWLGMETEGYVFVTFIYLIFCYSMSKYSMILEDRFNTGHK